MTEGQSVSPVQWYDNLMELHIVRSNETGAIVRPNISAIENETATVDQIAQELGLETIADCKNPRCRAKEVPGLIVVESEFASGFESHVNALIAEGYKVASIYCGPLEKMQNRTSPADTLEPPTYGSESVNEHGETVTRRITYIATMLLPDNHILSM